jgi:hypothetical protein
MKSIGTKEISATITSDTQKGAMATSRIASKALQVAGGLAKPVKGGGFTLNFSLAFGL